MPSPRRLLAAPPSGRTAHRPTREEAFDAFCTLLEFCAVHGAAPGTYDQRPGHLPPDAKSPDAFKRWHTPEAARPSYLLGVRSDSRGSHPRRRRWWYQPDGKKVGRTVGPLAPGRGRVVRGCLRDIRPPAPVLRDASARAQVPSAFVRRMVGRAGLECVRMHTYRALADREALCSVVRRL
jgi:hypothetical protein